MSLGFDTFSSLESGQAASFSNSAVARDYEYVIHQTKYAGIVCVDNKTSVGFQVYNVINTR